MNFKKHILPNGVRVILVPMKDNLTVTFGMYACTGSLYETKEQAGISHFLEHMCFKGTKKRPTPRSISLELDSIGARYNAYTWLEKTCYWAKAGAEHFRKNCRDSFGHLSQFRFSGRRNKKGKRRRFGRNRHVQRRPEGQS